MAGYKVGATSADVQKRLNMNKPFWGPIYDQTLVKPGTTDKKFSVKRDMIRGIEAEFAFRIKKDVVPRNKPYVAEELLTDYCDVVVPCVEVCASRLDPELSKNSILVIADTGNETLLFPDDSFGKNAREFFQSLPKLRTAIFVDGVKIAEGTGSEVLGSPATSLAWFVAEAVNGGPKVPLKKGMFVTTGATCGLLPITKKCKVRVSYSIAADCHVDFEFEE